MSAGYVIAQLKVTNSENYKEYVNKVTEIVKKFGGQYLIPDIVIASSHNFIAISFSKYDRWSDNNKATVFWILCLPFFVYLLC